LSEFRDKLLSIGFVGSRPGTREYRDEGVRVKEVTDEHGHVLTYRGDQPDGAYGVEFRPKTLTLADGRTLKHQET